MSTLQSAGPSEPADATKISLGTLGYIRGRHRQRQYDLVIREFKQSGISQRELADRLGKPPEVISRWLARPQNWEADTFSDLLFATSGAIAAYRADHPFRRHAGVPINLPNRTYERQEDIKPDLVDLGLLIKPKNDKPKIGGDLASQLSAKAA